MSTPTTNLRWRDLGHEWHLIYHETNVSIAPSVIGKLGPAMKVERKGEWSWVGHTTGRDNLTHGYSPTLEAGKAALESLAGPVSTPTTVPV